MNQTALVAIAKAIFETIHEFKDSIPTGPMYAALCGMVDLETFYAILDTLARSGHIQQFPNHTVICRCFGNMFREYEFRLHWADRINGRDSAFVS